MVALAIGLFLIAAVFQIYAANKQSYRTNEALSSVQ
jgi:Tfp pilus assembly protein PilW